jgi:putative ABC transport system permease protein
LMPRSFQPDLPDTRFVSRDFISAMGIPLVAGRTFGPHDRAGQSQVMLINRTLARSGLLGDVPLGKRFYAYGPAPWEVVGVVEDVRQFGPTENAQPQIFIDFRQIPDSEMLAGVGLYFAIRTDGQSTSVASSVRSMVRQLDRQLLIENVAPMELLVWNSIAQPRLYATLLAIFAGVAVVLAAIGIYGVMAHSVTERTREIGIRMALGAEHARVMRLVLGQSLVLTVAGIVLGLAGAAGLTRYFERLLFGLTPLDPTTFAAVALLFGAVATLAAFIPARRATKVSPLVALRGE